MKWEKPVLRQSQQLHRYKSALHSLWERGVLYPCFCNRRDILAAASAPQEGAPTFGPDGIVYPGTCRQLPRDTTKPMPHQTALRLDLRKAAQIVPETVAFEETHGTSETTRVTRSLHSLFTSAGDVVVSRRDVETSYHLSVVVDDAAQSITDVVRGEDLLEATFIHVILQKLLGLPTPRYHHHKLIRDNAGKRLAKRDDARAIATYRAAGATPDSIRERVGLAPHSIGFISSTE